MPETIKSNLRKVIYKMTKYLSDKKSEGLDAIPLNNITELVVNMTVNQILTLTDITTQAPGVYYIEELEEHRDAYVRMVAMRSGKTIEMSASDHLCHIAHSECVKAVSTTDLVCAQHAKYGLVNFPSLCEMRFQNCIIKSREVTSGKEYKNDAFYYNGQLKDCKYYVEKTETVEEAIERYFSEDKDKKLNAYTAKEKEKTAPQEK